MIDRVGNNGQVGQSGTGNSTINVNKLANYIKDNLPNIYTSPKVYCKRDCVDGKPIIYIGADDSLPSEYGKKGIFSINISDSMINRALKEQGLTADIVRTTNIDGYTTTYITNIRPAE